MAGIDEKEKSKSVQKTGKRKRRKQNHFRISLQNVPFVLYILIDKHDATRDYVQELAKQINYYSDSIREGYISWSDIERTVEEEFDVKVVWKKEKKDGI